MLNGVCVCFFFKKKQMDENVITLTISELTREFFFCLDLFFEKDASFFILFGIFLLHAIAELIREQVIRFIRITTLTLSVRDVFILFFSSFEKRILFFLSLNVEGKDALFRSVANHPSRRFLSYI